MRKIVLTGGPSGGKSSALSFLDEKLTEEGFFVLCVPEVPTIVINGGISPRHMTRKQRIIFQENNLRMQMALENGFASNANAMGKDPDKTVLLFDRGCLDVSSYVSPREFQEIMRRNRNSGWAPEMFLSRYDAVFHLVTAADGAEEFYGNENNSARHESPEQARKQDKKTFHAWFNHPHLRAIDNSTDFDGKLKRLLHEIQHFLGIPETLEIEKKFLLAPRFQQKDIPTLYQHMMIEQCYLKKGNDGATRRIRRRWQKDSGEIYFFTKKVPTGRPGVQKESERRIDKDEYEELKKEADPEKDVIVKQRLCFFYEWQHFELDVFLEPSRLSGLTVLELELTRENQRVALPNFLKVQREVTGEDEFSNANLAKKSCLVRV